MIYKYVLINTVVWNLVTIYVCLLYISLVSKHEKKILQHVKEFTKYVKTC